MPGKPWIFAERAYTDERNRMSRAQPGAVLDWDWAEACVAHAPRLIDAEGIVSVSGKRLKTPSREFGAHGDGTRAVAAGVTIRAAQGRLLVDLPEAIQTGNRAFPPVSR